MTERDKLIQEFIKRHGENIKESAAKQTGHPFFDKMWAEDEYDEHLYYINENGYMTQMTLEETAAFKKKYTRDEIKDKIEYSQIAHKIKPFDVFQAFFPYTNELDGFSIRPVIAIPAGFQEYRFMMVTKGKNTDPIYREYEITLNHWEEYHLPYKSYARANIIREPSSLVFIKNPKYYGSLNNIDIENIDNIRIKYINDAFINPIAFMYWCQENKIQDPIPLYGDNNNVNPIQTIEDIQKSKRANCVDLAIVSYKMAKNCKSISDSTIGTVSWIISPNKTNGHIFMLFKYKGKTYVFDYDQENCIGEFPSFKSQSFEKAALSYCDRIKSLHPEKEVQELPHKRQLIYILNERELKDLDHIEKYPTQKDWLRKTSALYNVEYNEEIFESMVDKLTLEVMYII